MKSISGKITKKMQIKDKIDKCLDCGSFRLVFLHLDYNLSVHVKGRIRNKIKNKINFSFAEKEKKIYNETN